MNAPKFNPNQNSSNPYFRMALCATRNEDDAKDVLQNFLIRAEGEDQEIENFRAYASQHIRWIAADYYNDKQKKEFHENIEESEDKVSLSKLKDLVYKETARFRDVFCDPRYAAQTVDRDRIIAIAMLTLDPTQEQMVRMKFFENMTYAEIGLALDMSESKVGREVRKALKEMREIIEILLGGPDDRPDGDGSSMASAVLEEYRKICSDIINKGVNNLDPRDYSEFTWNRVLANPNLLVRYLREELMNDIIINVKMEKALDDLVREIDSREHCDEEITIIGKDISVIDLADYVAKDSRLFIHEKDSLLSEDSEMSLDIRVSNEESQYDVVNLDAGKTISMDKHYQRLLSLIRIVNKFIRGLAYAIFDVIFYSGRKKTSMLMNEIEEMYNELDLEKLILMKEFNLNLTKKGDVVNTVNINSKKLRLKLHETARKIVAKGIENIREGEIDEATLMLIDQNADLFVGIWRKEKMRNILSHYKNSRNILLK